MARTETPRRVRGTQDIFGEEQRRFAHVLATFERVRALYCFQRIDIPVFEATEVFARSIGETTDVVSKEMYSFPDRGGDSLTLRPEFTAGIARAYLTEGWQQYAPLKLTTSGPVFRYERPQKGRYRQFHQIDAEVIGAAEPAADVELLVMADQLLRELGIAGPGTDNAVTLQLNTLGDAETRGAWRAALVAHFEAHRGDLSEDSVTRLEKNPMRILDSKDPRARGFFDAVTAGLDAAGVAWTRNARLVRGLDYYRHTAFEFVTDRLGAQGTVLAGGRYDGLIGSLGGPETPGVGWAAGMERLAMLVESKQANGPLVAVIPDTPAMELAAVEAAALLRRAGLSTTITYKGNSKKRSDAAGRDDVMIKLFLRGAEHPMGALHLSFYSTRYSNDEQHAVTKRVQQALGERFGWSIGSEGFNRP